MFLAAQTHREGEKCRHSAPAPLPDTNTNIPRNNRNKVHKQPQPPRHHTRTTTTQNSTHFEENIVFATAAPSASASTSATPAPPAAASSAATKPIHPRVNVVVEVLTRNVLIHILVVTVHVVERGAEQPGADVGDRGSGGLLDRDCRTYCRKWR